MGWSIGWDAQWQRDIGYGVPAPCEYPTCDEKIDRGLSFVCGSQPYGGDHGCGLYFCYDHLTDVEISEDPEDEDADTEGVSLCERCVAGQPPFEAKEDASEWLQWKLRDSSWNEWRRDNHDKVKHIQKVLRERAEGLR